MRSGRPNRCRGFTYLWVLIGIAMLGAGLAQSAVIWSKTSTRERLAELDWAGNQIKTAIESYYDATPGVLVKVYPQTLTELIQDRRYAAPVRHLRRLYFNPFTAEADWEPIRTADNRIRGVRARISIDSEEQIRTYLADR